jgi:N-acylethanolamine-hydrolysing acid amidase
MRSLILSVVVAALLMHGGNSATFDPPMVVVDMDGEAASRWVGALDAVLALHSWDDSFGALFDHINSTVITYLPSHVFPTVAEAIRTHFPVQYQELMGLAAGFAKHGHPEVTYEYLAVWAYYHSLGHANFGPGSAFSHHPQRECTGVLAANAGGMVTHGRNLDNEPAQLRNLTVHFQLRIGGHVVAEAMDWYWSGAGFVTVFMPGVISMEENWRKLYQDYNGSLLLEAIRGGAISQNWLFREALFTRRMHTFGEVLNFTERVSIAGPFYAIIAGAGKLEGAVVTRDPFTTLPTLLLSNQTGPDGWFLVETNYDHWLPDPKDDDRRTVAERTLRTLGQGAASFGGVLQVMVTDPVLNEDTVVTSVFQPATGAARWIGQDAH